MDLSEPCLARFVTRAFMGFLMLRENRWGFDVDDPIPQDDPEYGGTSDGFVTIFNAALHDPDFEQPTTSMNVVTDGNQKLVRSLGSGVPKVGAS